MRYVPSDMISGDEAEEILKLTREALKELRESPGNKSIAKCVRAVEEFEKLDKFMQHCDDFPSDWS